MILPRFTSVNFRLSQNRMIFVIFVLISAQLRRVRVFQNTTDEKRELFVQNSVEPMPIEEQEFCFFQAIRQSILHVHFPPLSGRWNTTCARSIKSDFLWEMMYSRAHLRTLSNSPADLRGCLINYSLF